MPARLFGWSAHPLAYQLIYQKSHQQTLEPALILGTQQIDEGELTDFQYLGHYR